MLRRSALFAAVLLVVSATPAFGHVSVTPKEAAKGSTTTFTFSVPNEEAPASTTQVEIVFPNGVTFETVAPQATPGWTATPGASSVTWSGGKISGEDKQTFTVTLGPLPNDATAVFKAIQTYDNGTIARWIGEASDDNPAPVVTLTGDPVAVATTTPMSSPTPSVDKPVVDEDEDGASVTFLIAGAMLLAGIGVGIVVAARRRTPQS